MNDFTKQGSSTDIESELYSVDTWKSKSAWLVIDLTERIRAAQQKNIDIDDEFDNSIIMIIDDIIEQWIEEYKKEDETSRNYHELTIKIWEEMYRIAFWIVETLQQVSDDFDLEIDNDYIFSSIKDHFSDYKDKVYDFLKIMCSLDYEDVIIGWTYKHVGGHRYRVLEILNDATWYEWNWNAWKTVKYIQLDKWNFPAWTVWHRRLEDFQWVVEVGWEVRKIFELIMETRPLKNK